MANIERMDAFVYRCPLEVPVRTSFGSMHDRPALLLRLRDSDGVEGWGEAWCNFPSITAEYRAQLAAEILGPLLLGESADKPDVPSKRLRQHSSIIALQSCEHGPFEGVIAGLDIAAHDLYARREGLSLCEALGRHALAVPVYASGIGPTDSLKKIDSLRQQGYSHFKLKVGFDHDDDLNNIKAILSELGKDEGLAIDANQGWDLKAAQRFLNELDNDRIAWVEEPLRADQPLTDWQALRGPGRTALAGGENLFSLKQFVAVIDTKAFDILQPDIAKWGGISLGKKIAQSAINAGLAYFPHYLGGGVGLAASAHLLAAVGGIGLLEVDTNVNPLREILLDGALAHPDKGYQLKDSPGLGFELPLKSLKQYLCGHWHCGV